MTTMPTEGAEILHWCNSQLVLLSQRAVWWPDRHALFIADPHFGKAATFRASAVPIPDDTTADLQRLDVIIAQTQATSLYILGDLLHARQGRCPTTFAVIHEWREQHPHLQVKLIIGNHDRRAGLPPPEWRIECLPEPTELSPFQLCHHPQFDDTPALAGHLHPKLRLQNVHDRVLAPCFFMRKNTLVLPAFGSLIDSLAIATEPGDQCFVIADEEIFRLELNSRPFQASR